MPTLVLAIAAASAWPQTAHPPGAYVPGPGQPMPFYFTSTNSRASGSVKAVEMPGRYINWAILTVGGVAVDEYVQPIGEPPPLVVSLGAMFDSTHFPDGTQAQVEVVATDNTGQLYTASSSAEVKNRLIAFEHADIKPFDHIVDYLDAFRPATYDYDGFPWNSNWKAPDVYAESSDASRIVFGTHGSYDVIAPQSGAFIDEPGLLAARAAINGSGFPPFNSTQNPSTHFVHIAACYVGVNNEFITKWLYPYFNGYGLYTENQAVHGYTDLTWFHAHANIVAYFEERMALGYCVWLIRAKFMDAEAQRAALNIDSEFPVGPDHEHSYFLLPGQGPIWGDFYTKTRGVYTGDDLVTLQFTRP